jgi:hypothetical protein
MKKLLIVVAFLFLTAPTLKAQNNTTRFFIACEYENITVDNTAGGKSFTSTEYKSSACGLGAALATFTIECSGGGTSCPIRIMLDGTTTVTASVGIRADYRDAVSIYSITNLTNFRAIREGATSAVINVQYFR